MSARRSATLSLEHVLLALLDARPMHGYELYQELASLPGIDLVWNIKQPMLYALLDKLESRGYLTAQMVQGEGYPPHKDFSLTEAGHSTLQSWTVTPVRRARDLRQEFLAKLIVARRYGADRAQALVRAQQSACQAWQAELEANLPPNDPAHADEWLVYSFRLNRVKAVLEWLDTCAVQLATPGGAVRNQAQPLASQSAKHRS